MSINLEQLQQRLSQRQVKRPLDLTQAFPATQQISDATALNRQRQQQGPTEQEIITRDRERGTTISQGQTDTPSPLRRAASKIPGGFEQHVFDRVANVAGFIFPTPQDYMREVAQSEPDLTDDDFNERVQQLMARDGFFQPQGPDVDGAVLSPIDTLTGPAGLMARGGAGIKRAIRLIREARTPRAAQEIAEQLADGNTQMANRLRQQILDATTDEQAQQIIRASTPRTPTTGQQTTGRGIASTPQQQAQTPRGAMDIRPTTAQRGTPTATPRQTPTATPRQTPTAAARASTPATLTETPTPIARGQQAREVTGDVEAPTFRQPTTQQLPKLSGTDIPTPRLTREESSVLEDFIDVAGNLPRNHDINPDLSVAMRDLAPRLGIDAENLTDPQLFSTLRRLVDETPALKRQLPSQIPRGRGIIPTDEFVNRGARRTTVNKETGRETLSPIEIQAPPARASQLEKDLVSKPLTPEQLNSLPKTQRAVLEKYPELATGVGLKGLKARGRGTISHDQSIQVANRLGWNEATVLEKIPQGRALNAEEIMAVRGLAKNADDVLDDMLRQLERMTPNSPEANALRQNISLQKIKAFNLHAVEVGASTEAGRALSVLRADVQSIDAMQNKIARVFNDPKTPQDVKDYIMYRIGSFEGTPKDFAKLLRELDTATWTEMMVEFATAMKLYAVPTHVVNTVTSLAQLNIDMFVLRPFAATINAIESTLRGTQRQRYFSDVKAMAVGSTRSINETSRNVARALADENFAWEARKMQDFEPRGPKIKGRPGKNGYRDAFVDSFGKGIRSSFRLLGVEDVLIRTPSEKAQIYAITHRQALSKGYKQGSKEYSEYTARYTTEPTPEMIQEASEFANRNLFQEDLSPFFQKVQKGLQDYPAFKFIIPFFRTPVNLLKQFIEYTPAGVVLPNVRQKLSGEAGVRADAIARMTLGGVVMAPLVNYALEDNITLAPPKNPAERDAFFAEGKQAYSIKIGDQWYPFHRISPYSEWFVTSAFIANAIKNDDDKALQERVADTFFSSAANMLDKSFAAGMNDLLNAITGQAYERERWLQNFVTGATMPTLMGNIARSQDPVLREVNSIKEAYMARTPGLSQRLPARRDAFGEDIRRPGSNFARLVSPVIPSPVVIDVVRDELREIDVQMGFPTRKVAGFDMDDQEYRDYQLIAGRMTYDMLFTIVTSPQWQEMSPRQREEVAQKTIRDVRSAARTYIAQDQIMMRELRNHFQGQGLTSTEANKRAEEVFTELKEKEAERASEQPSEQ